MLVAWRYRKRKSLVQWFDPRAWVIFYLCFLFSTLAFWDVRFLLPFFVIALFWLLTSGLKWNEIRRPFLFIGSFVFFFSIPDFSDRARWRRNFMKPSISFAVCRAVYHSGLASYAGCDRGTGVFCRQPVCARL